MLLLTAMLLVPQQTLADSWCPRSLWPGDYVVWTVDPDIAPLLQGGRPLGTDDIRGVVDRVVQNYARASRGRMQARVVVGDCVTGTNGCIAPVFDSDEPKDDCSATGTRVLAAAGCTVIGNCHAAVCVDATFDWSAGDFEKTLAHEFGHIYGMSHTNASPFSGTCDTGASTANCSGTSDGCDGETMCSRLDCASSSFFSQGDLLGLRDRFDQSAYTRRVYIGAEIPPIEAEPSKVASTKYSFFEPRIDCAKNPITSLNDNQCAMVTTSVLGSQGTRVSVIKLNGYSTTTNTFATISTVATIDFPSPGGLVYAPDIAVDYTGSNAAISAVIPTAQGRVHSLMVNLNTGSVTDLTTSLVAAAPVRVAYHPDRDSFFLVALQKTKISGTGGSFGVPTWGMAEAIGTTQQTVSMGSLDTTDGAVAAEFDVDCIAAIGSDTCTLVAVRLEDTNNALNETDRAWSRTFTISGGVGTPSVSPSASWIKGAERINSVQGLATRDSARRLWVSSGRGVYSNTTTNTRIHEFSALSVANGGLVATDVNTSDADTCASGSDNGFSLGGATMHGGYSWSFCPSCGSSSGRLISLHLGHRSDGDDFCF